MKYVVLQNIQTQDEELYLFPQQMEHKAFANSLANVNWKVVRAGFAWCIDGTIQCFGESCTLMLKSNKKKDTELLQRQFCNKD